MRKILLTLSLILVLFFSLLQGAEKPDIPQEFIRTEGTKFTDGNGKEFVIKALGLSALYRDVLYNEDTYKTLSSVGFNAVRFYLGANNIEDVAADGSVTYKEEALEWLDQHFEWAKKHNIKIVLCMMDAPGAPSRVGSGFFTNKAYQDRFVNLWIVLAKRYAQDPNIAAYDLVNEPTCTILPGDSPDNKFAGAFDLYQSIIQRTIDAIRTVDKNHVIIVERLWINGVNEKALGVTPLGYYNTLPNDQRDTWQNVNGKFNFPDLADDNYAYTYHVYEPGRYVHQYTGGDSFDDDGSGGPNRVYPSNTVAKWNENDPKTGKSWTMNKDFLEYSYTIPLEYIRNVKGVPVFIGELGTHMSNFENNAAGVNKGGRQWMLDTMEILDKHKLSFSYHPFRINEYHPKFNANLESAFRKAFGTE